MSRLEYKHEYIRVQAMYEGSKTYMHLSNIIHNYRKSLYYFTCTLIMHRRRECGVLEMHSRGYQVKRLSMGLCLLRLARKYVFRVTDWHLLQ